MKNPKDFLDLYMTVRDKDAAVIDKAMLALTKSITEVRKWRVMCQMWVGDVELVGGFGYAVELYRREPFACYQDLSLRLQNANVVCKSIANVVSRAVFGFDGRIKRMKMMREVYAYHLDKPTAAVDELCEWAGYESKSDVVFLMSLRKRSTYMADTAWSVWDKGVAEGLDRKQMYAQMRSAGLSDTTAERAIVNCQIITGHMLETYSTREHVIHTIESKPGLKVSEYVKLGAAEGYNATAYQRQVVEHMRLHGNVVDDLITIHAAIAAIADKTVSRNYNKWVEEMALAGCWVTAVYAWKRSLVTN